MMKSIAQPIKIALYCLWLPLTIISVGSLFWRGYPLELFSNFRVYYLILAFILAIAFFICQIKGLRVKLPLYISLGLIAFNSIWIVPWYLPHSQQGSGKTIRLLTFNINAGNDRWDAIADAITGVNPDIATVIESSNKSKEELSQRLKTSLPFIYRTSGGGITILSRFPLISPQTKTLKNDSILVTSVQINEKVVNLVATHPMIPIKPDLFKIRNASLAEISTYINKINQKPLILMGDFNLTLWSPYYFQLVRDTKLHNTRWGFGIEPSWIESATHVFYPNWITAMVKIPIDHIFRQSRF
jgi:endonuclease/exonuclease/phosphatase (EEP) superfamily protein YafD